MRVYIEHMGRLGTREQLREDFKAGKRSVGWIINSIRPEPLFSTSSS